MLQGGDGDSQVWSPCCDFSPCPTVVLLALSPPTPEVRLLSLPPRPMHLCSPIPRSLLTPAASAFPALPETRFPASPRLGLAGCFSSVLQNRSSAPRGRCCLLLPSLTPAMPRSLSSCSASGWRLGTPPPRHVHDLIPSFAMRHCFTDEGTEAQRRQVTCLR